MAGGGKFGWFIGIVFGAVFGVLFAPRKGKDLRERMKEDRKNGKLGISPLKDDMKHLGQELADMAVELYYSKPVQEIVEVGRERIQELSGEMVQDATDFHVKRIKPLQKKARSKLRKIDASAKIAKKAIGKIKNAFKKDL